MFIFEIEDYNYRRMSVVDGGLEALEALEFLIIDFLGVLSEFADFKSWMSCVTVSSSRLSMF